MRNLLKILERIRSPIEKRSVRMKKQVLIIYYAYRDPRIGLLPRALIFIALAIKLVPPEVIIAARQKAEDESPDLKKSWIFVPVIITLWILSGILVAYWIFRIVRT